MNYSLEESRSFCRYDYTAPGQRPCNNYSVTDHWLVTLQAITYEKAGFMLPDIPPFDASSIQHRNVIEAHKQILWPIGEEGQKRSNKQSPDVTALPETSGPTVEMCITCSPFPHFPALLIPTSFFHCILALRNHFLLT